MDAADIRTSRPLLCVKDLSVALQRPGKSIPILHNISFELRAGETLALIGASGSIEAAVIVEAIRRGELPPNVGLTNQDPEIPLTDIVREPREWSPAPALSNSFGLE